VSFVMVFPHTSTTSIVTAVANIGDLGSIFHVWFFHAPLHVRAGTGSPIPLRPTRNPVESS
jgi:hypothetical protein